MDENERDEQYEAMQADLESGECGLIKDYDGVYFCGRKLADEPIDRDDAIKLLHEEMEKAGFYPNIYALNDHGNVTLVDGEGKEVAAWV
jgi:hypothetical protein